MVAVSARLDEPCSAQTLKVLRGIGYRETGELSQPLDGALALGNMLEQDQPVRMPENPRKVGQIRKSLLPQLAFNH